MTSQYASIHKNVYSKMLDTLDIETVSKIMSNPDCKESVLLNLKVKEEVEKILAPSKEVIYD